MGTARRRLPRTRGKNHPSRRIGLRNEMTAVAERTDEVRTVAPKRLPARWLVAAFALLVVAMAAGMLFGAKSLSAREVVRALFGSSHAASRPALDVAIVR